MTVKQLIEKLQKADPEQPVFINDGFSLNMLQLDTVYKDEYHNVLVVCAFEIDEDDYAPSKIEIL